MMEFLYFPEDKMEYIPAFISLTIFMIGAVAAMYFFYKKSKKDEQAFNEKFEEQLKQEEKHSTYNDHSIQ
ncbi:hypothetical protein JNUCC1_03106 [Lentibacillus sp. JNUCC-1]|uniref:hypothetical protein n=1 Tax=Lentibacillus sp. JNUCC-1 TaxID=2654513 RepID=UPI0012E8B71E|nr:hypothetical protein [Lentibacillus sp. JNUCC-1]MUV39233.1 hypothetical protein [Lentibacillus sp. JNUCC-1]